MASTKQNRSLTAEESPSGLLDYILQPVREYNRDNSLRLVARWMLTVNNLNTQFIGETLLRVLETREKMDSE